MKFNMTALLLGVALLTGCAIAEGPREKLAQQTFQFNQGLRWGRYNEVLPRVDPGIMDHFMEQHQDWGKTLQLSSAEIISTQYDEKAKKAVLEVQFSWYRKTEMVAKATVTRQHWAYDGGRWIMMAEEFAGGDPF